MMIVNKTVIGKLKPCSNLFDNFVAYYRERELSMEQFMGLRNISHQDKMWVAFRLMPKENLRFAAADMAELVLPIFESAYPNDDRPRKAIEAARNGDFAAYFAYADATYAAVNAFVYADATYAAANADAANAAARSAARSAANAAVRSAAYAARSAAYADADAAVYAASYAIYADPNLEKQIRRIVLKYMKERK